MGKFLFALLAALTAVASAETTPAVRVSVSSQPSGATVLLDGKDRGTTPLTLFDVAPGRHHLKFRLAGYHERDRFFRAEGGFVEKNEVLESVKGLLLVKTDPEGCNISIDGVAAGQTPRLITHLDAKDTYSVKLTKAGYQDQVISVKFDGRTPLVRTERLVLDSGVIDIRSEPSGAAVTVNGVPRGKTPVLVKGIPKGRATVKFVLAGFREEVRELVMRAGDRQMLPIMLKALPGTLHLTSVPSGGRFYLNDEMRGVSPLTVPGLEPGEYTVRCEREGYGTLTRTVTIANGASAREEFRLSNVMGRLELRTDPPGATVLFDGRPVGVTKGVPDAQGFSDVLAVENVLEGEHVLVVRKDGYREATRHPRIAQSQTAKGTIRLERVFTPDVEIVTASGTHRGVLVSNGAEGVLVEVSMGIMRSFSRDEIRKLVFLNGEKAK